MSVEIVTRQEMVDAMETQFNANVTEHHGYNWRRMNTITANQHSVETPLLEFEFHLFEFYGSGRVDGRTEGHLEDGNASISAILPGTVSYLQTRSPVKQCYKGSIQVQQICIDDSIFRKAAESIAPGDPDNLRPLGFLGIFEPELRRLGERILDEARAGAPGGELYADLLAQQIALLILRRRLGRDEKQYDIHPLSDIEISRVIEFMEANLEDVGGLDTLACLINMDVFSFSRAFKMKTGEAPHQFLIGRRLIRAREMLRDTTYPLAEIAYATGFSSQSHMTATFTKHFGTPPGVWRKTVKT